jgi:methylenetetrahydrofolate dehydrogenase (NADP+)/methenyltetrahydrofolate cyclohydrolase
MKDWRKVNQMIIDGKEISKKIREEVKREIKKFGYKPKLAILMAGDDESSKVYANSKVKACENVGIEAKIYYFSESEESKFFDTLKFLNEDKNTHGIMIEMPLPKNFNAELVYDTLNPYKDVDCISNYNMGRLFAGKPLFVPCTPKAILHILECINTQFEGKHAVVIGRSNILGKPVAKLLLDKNCTVTVCHSKTKDLAYYTRQADILVLAAGKMNLVKGDMVKEGAILIDAGINVYQDNIYGDADFESVKDLCSYVTPVPGGVGPVTTAMILKNTLEAFKYAVKGA